MPYVVRGQALEGSMDPTFPGIAALNSQKTDGTS